MARSTTLAGSTKTQTKKTIVPFHQQTPAKLAGVDVQALEGEELMSYAQAAKDRLEDLTSSVYVDKRSNILYLGDRQIGCVARPLFKAPGRNPTAMIPSIFKSKDEHYDAKSGEISIPKADQLKGFDTLDFNLLAVTRFQMARIAGNGVSLLNQRSKDDDGVALAIGNSKSGSI